MELAVQQVGANVVEKNQPEEGLKGESENSGSMIPIHEGANNKNMPNKTDEEVQSSVLKHEKGKASQTRNHQRSHCLS